MTERSIYEQMRRQREIDQFDADIFWKKTKTGFISALLWANMLIVIAMVWHWWCG